jgi:hypothetical protein
MRYFALFLFIMASYYAKSQIVCDSIFAINPQERLLWVKDSIGKNGDRFNIYLHHFFKYPQRNRERYKKAGKECIIRVFGWPNRILVRDDTEYYIYYVKKENDSQNSFQGVTLEITFKCNIIMHFAFYVT